MTNKWQGMFSHCCQKIEHFDSEDSDMKRLRQALPKSLSLSVLETLSSVRFAVALVAVIGAVCIAGTVGFANVFYTWWFVGLLGLLAATVAVAARDESSRSGGPPGSPSGERLDRRSRTSAFCRCWRAAWCGASGAKDFVELCERETKSEFQIGNRPKPQSCP